MYSRYQVLTRVGKWCDAHEKSMLKYGTHNLPLVATNVFLSPGCGLISAKAAIKDTL